jgi:hypothetical protein
MKPLYAVAPFLIGSEYKSVAIVIPARVARKLRINDSTILTLKPDDKKRTIVLEPVEV